MKKTIFITTILIISAFLMNSCITSKDTEEDSGGIRTDAELTGTYWKVTDIGDTKVTTIPNEKEIYIIFEDDGNFKGFSGCNRFYGKHMYDATTIKIESIESTRMACTSLEREAKLYTALQGEIEYVINGEDLTLTKNNKLIATLEVGAMK